MRKLFFLSVLGISIALQNCYVAKPLERKVRISVNTDFPVIIKNEGASNFSSKHSDEEYRKAYLAELTTQLNANHILIDPSNPEFVVKITSLEITESTKPDTVKNEKSKDNGMVRDLTLAGLKTTGTVTKAGSSTSSTWEAEKDKNEQLTSNRSLDQVIAGQNKDGTEYREKAFDDNEFVVQAGHCGRRAAVRITHDIRAQLK